MSTCNCGLGGNQIPKPLEDKNYASVNSIYDNLRTSTTNGKKYSSFEYFLIIMIILILFIMVKDYKC